MIPFFYDKINRLRKKTELFSFYFLFLQFLRARKLPVLLPEAFKIASPYVQALAVSEDYGVAVVA